MKIFFSIVFVFLDLIGFGQLTYQKPDSNRIIRANSQVEVASLLVDVNVDFFENSYKMQSMIKMENDDRSFYFCESADWSAITIAGSEADAAKRSLTEANEFYDQELQLSPCMRVKKIA